MGLDISKIKAKEKIYQRKFSDLIYKNLMYKYFQILHTKKRKK